MNIGQISEQIKINKKRKIFRTLIGLGLLAISVITIILFYPYLIIFGGAY